MPTRYVQPEAPSLPHLTRQTSVTLEEVNSAAKFVQVMDKIELPNQLAAVLADPLLQKLLALRKDETTSRRVTQWIGAALADFLEGNADNRTFVDMMDVLADYVARTKVGLLTI